MIKLNAMLIAEYAGSATDSKLTIAGTFDGITAERAAGQKHGDVAVRLSRAYLAVVTEASIADGLAHTFLLRVLTGNGNPIIQEMEMAIHYALNEHGRPMKNQLVVDISGLIFPGPDDYTFELRIKGNPTFRESCGFHVAVAPSPMDG
jgi:hypothetical protein